MARSNSNTARQDRFNRDDNEHGVIGIDHFAMPADDIELMARFIEEVLGGEPYYVTGFDPEDEAKGKPRQVFMRVGNVLMQCAEPITGGVTVGKGDTNPWPHWAFLMSAEGLQRNLARLDEMGIPYFGPAEHVGGDSFSAYFASPEGHKLELVTYDDYPAEKVIGIFGPKGAGTPQWADLFYEWTPSS
ncbi:MAG: VOC family protein [Actinobacteria bacterium]|nr:VOC family protein [Actinomycetota bacterium]